ncbi:mitogen-activated protein kinase kinase kinase 1 [Spatholobus suberectus]|nr:mitogen-activated protein kinase kinase kinase 1 [Spatholobus suberectus]
MKSIFTQRTFSPLSNSLVSTHCTVGYSSLHTHLHQGLHTAGNAFSPHPPPKQVVDLPPTTLALTPHASSNPLRDDAIPIPVVGSPWSSGEHGGGRSGVGTVIHGERSVLFTGSGFPPNPPHCPFSIEFLGFLFFPELVILRYAII